MPSQSALEVIDQWKSIWENPQLADLPYKIETSGSGKIIMSPPKNRHSLLQGVVYDLLKKFAASSNARFFRISPSKFSLPGPN